MRIQPPDLGRNGPRMARRRHTPEQILARLRDAEVLAADGLSAAEVAKRLEISEQTFHRWRSQYGGMKGAEMKRIQDLERENAALKRPVAKQALDTRCSRTSPREILEPGEQRKGGPARHGDTL